MDGCEFASHQPYECTFFALFATDILFCGFVRPLLPPRHHGTLLAGHGLVAQGRVRGVWVGAGEVVAFLGLLFPQAGQLGLPVPITVVDVAAAAAAARQCTTTTSGSLLW